MPTDEHGRLDPGALGPDPTAPDPAELAQAGPGVLAAMLTPWRAALAEAPGLGAPRRERLEGYLDELELELRASLGDLPTTWRADLRRRLGIKAQTWSDDWQLLGRLLEAAP